MTPQYLIERLKFEAQGTHGDVPLFHLKSMQRKLPTAKEVVDFRQSAQFLNGEPVYPADILEMFRFLEGGE
jgi:hypothetical protein